MRKHSKQNSSAGKAKSPSPHSKSATTDIQPQKSENTYTAEQLKAISTKKKVAEVVAGAGTGKTLVLCGRASHLAAQGQAPNRIHILTFTVSARKNIQERLSGIAGCEEIKCSTFHAFCLNVLGTHCQDAGLTSPPSLLEDSNQKNAVTGLINQISKQDGVPLKQLKKAVANAIKRKPSDQNDLPPEVLTATQKVVAQLKAFKKVNNYLSYDDMLSRVAKLIRLRPEIADKLAQGIDHLMVDELQDISKHEVEIIYQLASRAKSTVLVGDKKQAIFGFRGSDLACWDTLNKRLKKQFKSNFKQYFLTESFRVPNRILNLSNAVGQDICDDPPLTSKNSGLHPRLFIAKNAEEQGQFINNQIDILKNNGVDPENIAVLGRTRRSLFQIKNQLTHFEHGLNENYRTSKADTEKALRALIRITRRLHSDAAKKPPQKSLRLLIDYLGLPQDVSDTLFQRTFENGWLEFKIPKKTASSESVYRGINNIREQVLLAKNLDPEAGTQLLIDALNRFIEYRYGKETPTIRQDLSRLKLRLREYSAWDEIDFRDIELCFTDSGINLYTIHGAKGALLHKSWSEQISPYPKPQGGFRV